MVQVSLGNIFNVGGRQVYTGGASGLDIEALITSLVEAKSIPITQLQDKIDLNTSKISAFSELKTLLNNFEQAAGFLRNPPGVLNADKNIFEYRSATLFSSTATPGESYVNVTADPGAAVGDYEIEVQQLAQKTVQRSDVLAGVTDLNASVVEAVPTANRFTAGTLTIDDGAGGTLATITLNDGDSLNDIMDKINAQTDTTNVTATAIKVGTDQYRLQLSTTEANGTDDFTINIASNTGVGGVTENVLFTEITDHQGSQFSINGVTVNADTNTIDDAIEGLTFELRALTAGATVTAEVDADSQLVADGIINFVDAYNELKLFIARQSERGEDGLPKDTAILANDSTLRTIALQIEAELTTTVQGVLGGGYDKLQDIGITFEDFAGDSENPPARNIMNVDPVALENLVRTNLDKVRSVFEFTFTTDNSDLIVFKRTNDLAVTSFSLDIDTVAETAEATYDLGDGNGPQTISLDYEAGTGAITLTGQDGTVLEGLQLIYGNTVDATINVTLSQGIADRVYNLAEAYTTTNDGLLDQQKLSISQSSERFKLDIAKLNEQIDKYRIQLLERFTALEQALANVNKLLQALEAQSNAQLANS